MALTDENGMVMPVTPMSGNGFGGGLFGGDLSIIVLFFLFMMMGGWGNGFGGFGGGDLYPWMNNSQNINAGFRDQMLDNQLTGIQNSIAGGFAGITSTLNSNQMADLERSFAVQSQLQNCCCENRASVADLKYTVATEACADRSAISDALQTVIASNNAGFQKILDRMCQQEIDALKASNVALQNQVNMLNLSASQTAQTASLIADNTAQTQYIVNRIAPYPVPAYTVANPNTPVA